jgi:hypothetical protein
MGGENRKVTVSRNTRMFALLSLSPIAEAFICIILLSLGRELGAFSRKTSKLALEVDRLIGLHANSSAPHLRRDALNGMVSKFVKS